MELFKFDPQDKQTKIRILPPAQGAKLYSEHVIGINRLRDGCGIPVRRYMYPVIVRGREAEGPKWLMVSPSVHRNILKGIVEHPIKPRLSRRQRAWQWVAERLCNYRLTNRLGRVMFWLRDKYFPQVAAKTVLDTEEGCDFILRCSMRRLRPDLSVPDYSFCHFVPASSPAGSPAQVGEWLTQVKDSEMPKVRIEPSPN